MRVLGFLPVAFLLTLFPLAHATTGIDVPYNFSPNPAWNCVNMSGFSGSDMVNGGQPLRPSWEGVSDTKFTGKTLHQIRFWMCRGLPGQAPGCPTSPNSVTFGIFNKNTGALVQSFGTIPFNSLPCDTSQSPALVGVTGSHVMMSGEAVGISFTDTSNNVGPFISCGDPCNSSQLPNGEVDTYFTTAFEPYHGVGTLVNQGWDPAGKFFDPVTTCSGNTSGINFSGDCDHPDCSTKARGSEHKDTCRDERFRHNKHETGRHAESRDD